MENVHTESSRGTGNNDLSQPLIQKETSDTVKMKIKILPEDEQKLIELAFYEGFTHSEIAELLDMPLGTVKTKIRKAVGRMRDTMLEEV